MSEIIGAGRVRLSPEEVAEIKKSAAESGMDAAKLLEMAARGVLESSQQESDTHKKWRDASAASQ